MAIKITVAATLALVTMSLGTTSAFAGCSKGFFANLACEVGVIDKRTANAADRVHADFGRPIDRFANQAAGAAADAVVPGSGMYVTQGLEMRDRFNRSGGFNQGGYGQSYGQGYGQGGYGQSYGQGYGQGGGYRPVSQTYPVQSQSGLGNFCLTEYGAAAMSPSPVGYRCIVPTYNGPIAGVVVY